jgi:hypothetical protein
VASIQIAAGTSATIQETFYSGGTPTDLDTGVPAVTITKPDGTTIASGTVSHVGAVGSGVYQFVLASLADPIVLSITWTGTIGGQPQTLRSQVEVVGTYLFTIPDLRAVKVGGGTPFTDPVAWPASLLATKRAEVTDDFANRTGWSFVPRFAREVHDGGTGQLVLAHLKASKLLSVTVNGVASSLSGWTLRPSGVLEATSAYGWGSPPVWGRANVVVEYVHGFDQPPPAVASAGLARAAMLLLPSVSSTTSSWTTPDGTTYSYDQAGQSFAGGGRRHYGVPAIDSVLSDPAYNALGMAVA